MTSLPFVKCVAFVVLVVSAWPVAANAQAVLSGTLTGTVRDETGAMLPGTTVTLTDTEKGVTFQQVTDSAGVFRFIAVPIGNDYELKAELYGFSLAIVQGIQVLANYTQRFTLTMHVGPVTEEVTVAAEAPLLAVGTSTSSETLKANVVDQLPLYSRNKTEVATLMAGTTFSRAESPGAWYEFHVRGDATVAHGWRVDGATTITGHGRTALSVPQNSVERFEFIAGGFQAEYGEQTGGMVNVITKTGTNKSHGAYSGLFRPEKLASKVDSGIPGQVNDKQPGNTQFHELSAGGPIVRDRFWYHVAYQYWQDDRGNLLQPTVLNSDLSNFHAKLTYQQAATDRWDLGIEHDPFWQTNTTLQSNYAPEAQTFQDVDIYLVNLQQSHTFNDNTTLQSQVYLHHLAQRSGGLTARNGGTVDASNYRPFVAEVTRQGTFYTGYRNTRGNWSEYRLRASEKFNAYRGDHNIKIGFDYAYLWGSRWTNVFGSAYTDRRPIGGTLTRSIPLEPDPWYRWGAHDMAAYAQDNWAVTDRVTIDYGLRWDYQSEVRVHNFAPRLGVGIDPGGDGTKRIYANFGLFYQNLWAFSWAFDRLSLGNQLYRIDNPTAAFPNDPYQRLLIGRDVLLKEFRNRIGDRYVNPYNVSWTVGYETLLPATIKLSVSYSETNQHDWLFTLVTPTEQILQSDNCGENELVPECGRYRGLEVTLRKPFSKKSRFELLQTYTWSKVKGLGNLQGQSFNVAQIKGAYGVQDWDQPHVINTTAMIEMPYRVLLSGVFRWASGRPYSIDNAQVGTEVLYVDRQGRPSVRNAERLPAQSSLDLGVQRSFDLGRGGLRLEFQGLNITNRVNVLRVQSSFAAAGTPTQVDFSRQIQLGVGFTW